MIISFRIPSRLAPIFKLFVILIIFFLFSVTIGSLVLASKFFLEANEVVVNCDIARVLGMSPQTLNKCEYILSTLLEFNVFVSPLDYNRVACIFNQKVKAQSIKDNQTASSTQFGDKNQCFTQKAFLGRKKFNSQMDMIVSANKQVVKI